MRSVCGFGAALATAILSLTVTPILAAETAVNPRQLICHMVDQAASTNRLPASFLTRILWQESRFRTDVTSPAGAEGVAQFMPRTAAERGLENPYDPAPAIAHAARLLAEHAQHFGSLGLAAAAYNAGAGNVAKWLRTQSGLPTQTRLYVLAVTGHSAEEWARAGNTLRATTEPNACFTVTAELARPGIAAEPASASLPPRRQMAAWQLKLDAYLAKAVRLKQQPPGTVPVSVSTRAAATMCDRIRSMGMPCEVYTR